MDQDHGRVGGPGPVPDSRRVFPRVAGLPRGEEVSSAVPRFEKQEAEGAARERRRQGRQQKKGQQPKEKPRRQRLFFRLIFRRQQRQEQQGEASAAAATAGKTEGEARSSGAWRRVPKGQGPRCDLSRRRRLRKKLILFFFFFFFFFTKLREKTCKQQQQQQRHEQNTVSKNKDRRHFLSLYFSPASASLHVFFSASTTSSAGRPVSGSRMRAQASYAAVAIFFKTGTSRKA